MKLISSALLLCAGTVMAAKVSMECTGLLQRCPKGWKQEWHGRNMLNAKCICMREETAAEKQAKDERYRETSCSAAADTCKKFDSAYGNDNGKTVSCDDVIRWCDRPKIDEVCNNLKERSTKWQCGYARTYKDMLAGKPWTPAKDSMKPSYGTGPIKQTPEEIKNAEEKRKACETAKTECDKVKRKYPNTDPRAKPCEDISTFCSWDMVERNCQLFKAMRTKYNCENSAAYKARKKQNDLIWAD